ncbi:MAG: serine/threonine-protein kinase [Pirellulaceae bacterium]
MASRPDFRNTALLSGLVSKLQLEEAERALREDGSGDGDGPATLLAADDQLAAKLVDLGVITPYQSAQLQAGRTKLNLGPYQVTDYIDKGGMGQVYKAEHDVMGRVVAVKVLPLDKATPEAIENFRREVRTQAQLDHPHLVAAFDAGRDGRVHYLVTEYIPGTDLRRLVRTNGPLPMHQAAGIIMQASRGLAYAHQRGLIHRDVKPGNILVTPNGIAKVSDLGLAGFIHDADNDPLAWKIVGTPDYLAPERIENPGAGSSISDIYSLGCTVYYTVTGKVPFPGGSPKEKARRHREETPWHPRRFNPDLTDEFVEIIEDMMAKDPLQRIQSAGEVATRLEPFAIEQTRLPTSTKLFKSPWMPQPLPTGHDSDDAQATEVGEYEQDNGSSVNQFSQVTAGSGAQDTLSMRRRALRHAPPLALTEPPDSEHFLSRGVSVAIALAISIPVSMLLGALLSFFLLNLFGRP